MAHSRRSDPQYSRHGRTLAITQGEVHAERDGKRTLVALMQQTLMVMHGKADA